MLNEVNIKCVSWLRILSSIVFKCHRYPWLHNNYLHLVVYSRFVCNVVITVILTIAAMDKTIQDSASNIDSSSENYASNIL